MKAIILAAGIGSRIGAELPKCLTVLPSGKTLIENQIDIIKANKIREIIVVVGFKKEFIMEAHPDVLFQYNPVFHITNTAISLLSAVEHMNDDDFIWLNGDVYLENEVLKRVIENKGNTIAVNKQKCGEEEVKYSVSKTGHISAISKSVTQAKGEAVGVNKVTKKNISDFRYYLKQCSDKDYFEKAIELSIKNNMQFKPVDVSDCNCIEIDFKKDLAEVRKLFRK